MSLRILDASPPKRILLPAMDYPAAPSERYYEYSGRPAYGIGNAAAAHRVRIIWYKSLMG